ncbi:aminotransferase class IV [Bernardetia sp. Wsw4-3y2]|uniref:aminotransferase class IV n=1 Tax=Bernardetia sp. Wsw4-3y2 TaxID=3127471 RepID=UPI0030D5BB11
MLNHNGKIYQDKNTLLFSAQNRAFSYADALFETIRIVKSIENESINYSIPLWDYHFERLSKGMEAFGYDKLESDFLKDEILKTATLTIPINTGENRVADFKARLTVFRSEGGLYTPTSSTPEFVIVLQEIPKINFLSKNNNDLETLQRSYVFFDELPLFPSTFSPFKKTDALPYVLAGKYRKEQQADEVFLLNNQNRIAEVGAANVFVLDRKLSNERNKENNKLHFITPPSSEGGVMGTMRNYIVDRELKNYSKTKFEISIEEKPITKQELNQAKIIFTTNAVQSIQIIKITTQKQLEIMIDWINEVNHIFEI